MKLFLATIITCLVFNITPTKQSNYSNQEVSIIAKPNCLPRCGNVSIPFPFGIGSDCFLNKWFEIVCENTTSGYHRPFLKQITGVEVLNISIDDSVLQTRNPIHFFDCPDKESPSPNKPGPLSLTGSPFSYSDSRNRLTAVSCNVFAFIDSNPDNVTVRTAGCTSVCAPTNTSSSSPSLSAAADQTDNNSSNGCDGMNCCQTIIPSYLKSYEVHFDPTNGAKHCRYAFVVDQAWFEGRLRDFAVVRDMDYVPVTLNWDLLDYDNITINTTSYWGLRNFQCYPTPAKSSINGRRLKCRCNNGYRGNPYLSNGCQDINECDENSGLCSEDYAYCVNTPGSYRCEYKTVHKIRPVLIGVSSGVGALVLIFGAWGLSKLIKRRKDIKRKERFFKQNGGLLLQQQIVSSGEVMISVDRKTKLFNSKELEKATDHYNTNRILGQGGQGTVYKGMLEDGKIVAVKKSKLASQGKVTEFINEVVILSQISHRNVVKLLGCCLETEVPLLVYEFIPNGTLHHYLHDHNEEFQLTWEMRLQIAIEVAGALSYLHSAASIPIYHRDIKSTNILLDEKYRAKVADFGTSRSISEDRTHITTLVSGTFGYMDPEYFRSSQFTEKSDVYSFGVVIIELLSAQKPVSLTSSRKGSMSLATHFIECMEENRVFDIVDPRIINEACSESIRVVANLAYRCLDLVGKNRPTMKEVATELEGTQKSLEVISSDFDDHMTCEKAAYSRPSQVVDQLPRGFATTTSIGSGYCSTSSTGAALSIDAQTTLSSLDTSM
ncbi:Wall-associated receptor kinase [Trema orientale]|uniref:Wall-associated receptor kinase n=1 Tax=Trema orientale TaxID=63057 RepID=A0A2P5EVU7_TREOI|nr:Wall-associated receptor kinase [Trema orientale]